MPAALDGVARPAVRSASPGPGRPGRIAQVPEFQRWLAGQDRDMRTKVMAQAQRAHDDPGSHHRPRVDTIKGSRMHNLKELRISRTVRVLIARDPDRNTVLLFGGDKAGHAKRFYRDAVPTAERRYARHLNSIGKEAPWQHRNPPNRRPPSQER